MGRTAKIMFMVAVIGILLMACYFLYFGVKRASSSEQIERKLQQLRASEPSVGILTAYYGSEYEIMGTLADMTKQKYADLYGYKYYVDNHLFRNDMSWGQKSAIRTTSVREHLKDHDWYVPSCFRGLSITYSASGCTGPTARYLSLSLLCG